MFESIVREKEQKKAEPNRTGIPTPMKQRFETLSGLSFNDVTVHYNSDKPAQLQALAYTQGNQVNVAPGQEKHLGHELGHVVQQKQGRVRPTMQLQGMNINNAKGLEREADVIGMEVVQLKRYNCTLKVNEKITEKDMYDWSNVRRKLGATKGGDANSSIASEANKGLARLGFTKNEDKCMSAHMIPNRIGGAGNKSNVRPWLKEFETGKWENEVEKKFNELIPKAEVGKEISYNVETEDMTDEEARKVVSKHAYILKLDKTQKDECKNQIVNIPKSVKANVSNGTKNEPLSETSECTPIKD